jgi:hypothetical protein
MASAPSLASPFALAVVLPTLASGAKPAMSLAGTSRNFSATQNSVAIGACPTSIKLDLRVRVR